MTENKKHILDFTVRQNLRLGTNYALLKLMPTGGQLPPCEPGQFAQVLVPNSKNTFLRRPISICNIDRNENLLWLLVRRAGEGTAALCDLHEGDILNVMLPLGHGFTLHRDGTTLLVGGGVGVAPLFMLGKVLKEQGMQPVFLLGARSKGDLLLIDKFTELGEVHITTDDGSAGVHGVVTKHPVLTGGNMAHIACCGPMPMMRAVAALARRQGIDCEVSLENLMACGMGACLCCVEDTADAGNVCVCTEGPVFNINRLKWQI